MKNNKQTKATKRMPKDEDPRQYIFKCLLSFSEYDFSGLGFGYRRNEDIDTDDSTGFDVFLSKAKTSDNATYAVTEIFTVSVYGNSFKKTVKEFDERVAKLAYITLPKKEAKMKKTNKCGHKCRAKCPSGCKKTTPKPTAKPKPGKKRVTPVIDDLKKTVLECSKYAVPSSRVKFVADHVDVKHGNFVYEVRFFQKSYKSVPADKQSHETAYLNVRTGGDRDDLIAKRFDKAVKELKTVAFKLKKQ